jgi:two-component system invasion response regulator UvrY
MKEKIKIALVDDHTLFRKGLAGLVKDLDPLHHIIWEAENGKECLVRIQEELPDILLMDVSMPVMDGYQLAEAIKQQYPALPILVVSMVDKEESLIRMLRAGIRGYLSKDTEPEELLKAISSILNKGYYYTDHITGKLIKALQDDNTVNGNEILLSDREKQLLELVCSDDTYKEIADKMFLSPKTVDTYRMSLFEKLQVKSRTGLVLYAIRTGIVNV